jgi:hypothetical protein
MMQPTLRYSAAAIATIGLLASAACSSSGGSKSTPKSTPKSTDSSTSSSAAKGGAHSGSAPTNDELTATLIGGGDIPGDTFTLHDATAAPQGGGTAGIVGSFTNKDASRTVTDILVWFPTAAAAATATAAEQKAVGGEITGSLTDAKLDVGTGGHLYTGTTDQGLAAVALYQEGNYVVTQEFDSKAGDTIPASVVTQVAQAQDSKVKAAS